MMKIKRKYLYLFPWIILIGIGVLLFLWGCNQLVFYVYAYQAILGVFYIIISCIIIFWIAFWKILAWRKKWKK